MSQSMQIDIQGHPFSIETGKVAKQADGSVVVRYGDSMVLATVVATKTAKEGQDFFPVTVDYRERAYAGGRIPGGYFKREGAPVKKEVLTSRLIDRPIRPLFPEGFKNEVQVICLAISGDPQHDPDVLAMNGASAALALSGIPFSGPVGAVRVGLVDGQFVANPTTAEQAVSQLELVVAGTEEGVLMVEAGAKEVSEEKMLEAIAFGHDQCKRLARLQKELAAKAGKPRWAFDPNAGRDTALIERVKSLAAPKLAAALAIHEKHPRAEAVGRGFDEVWGALGVDGSKQGGGRGAPFRLALAPRHRPRGARRARGGGGAARQGRLPLHDPRGLRHPRVQRLVVDGHRVRRLAVADGRRRAAQVARGRHRHGPGEGRGQVRDPHRHHGHRGPLR